jgi:signal transduction histidine kinase
LLDVLKGEARTHDRAALQRVLDLDLALMLHTYRQDMEAKQAKAERLATYGQLVGSIGHELRNPLGVIETSVYLLRSRAESDPKVGKHLDRISGQITVANSIITQLLDLIRDRPLDRQPVALMALIAEVSQAVPRPPEVGFELPDAPQLVSGDRTMLRQVLVNLVENAVQAVGPRGRVSISVSTEAPVAVLHVDDSGPGVDHSIAQRLFEPLVTTKAKGIGLGLALVKRIVERHGGTIEAGRGPLGGARFTLRLPEHHA